MTVQWLLGQWKGTPEELASLLVAAMPEELSAIFKKLKLL